ncbi:MAG: NAD(P)-dependent alcohol dehydrogenase [Paracoccaceae bacterium]
MKAAIARRYGPPEAVDLVDLPVPVPRAGQVLVEVTAAAVTVGDARIRAARAPAGMAALLRLAFGLVRPRRPVLGMMFAGRVIGAGSRHAVGARVIGTTGMAMGAHAEMVAVAGDRLLPLDLDLTDAEAAALLFGGMTAADFLIDKAALAPGQRLLVNGATGEVGCAALQIGRHLGAEVTAVCREENHPLARVLGATACHDYRQGPPQGQWDAVLDLAGTLPFAAARALGTGRRADAGDGDAGPDAGRGAAARRGGRRITGTVTGDGPDAVARVLDLARQGALRPVVGHRLPLSEIRRAHALCDGGHKRGSVVVVMDQATETAMAAK